MNSTLIATVIIVFSVFISSISQIILKKSTQKKYQSIFREYCNPMVIFSYGVFMCSTIINVFAIKYIPLSLAPILESLSYIFVGILGYIYLGEQLSKRNIVGMCLIMLGILVFSQ